MFLGERLGVDVDRSMKSHLELAGEGIEYSWGQVKSVYWRAKLSQKKGMENFHFLVSNCLSIEEGNGKGGLTAEMVRVFMTSKVVYPCLLLHWTWDEGQHKRGWITWDKYWKYKKEFKTHRSAIDFDEKFINYCFHKTDSNTSSDKSEAARASAENNTNNAS